jgi:hypothetical protein
MNEAVPPGNSPQEGTPLRRSGRPGTAAPRSISDAFRERFGVDISTFAGARAAGEVPLSDEFINRLIAERLANHAQISSLHVAAQQGDAIAVEIIARARLIPPLRILARIERQPEPQNPILLLRWSMPSAGPLALFAAPVLSYFKAMPPGVRMEGDRLEVDVRELLVSRGMEEVLAFIRRLEIHTRPGAVIAQFEVGVE